MRSALDPLPGLLIVSIVSDLSPPVLPLLYPCPFTLPNTRLCQRLPGSVAGHPLQPPWTGRPPRPPPGLLPRGEPAFRSPAPFRSGPPAPERFSPNARETPAGFHRDPPGGSPPRGAAAGGAGRPAPADGSPPRTPGPGRPARRGAGGRSGTPHRRGLAAGAHGVGGGCVRWVREVGA
jgi:hypothetical protein